ncbi:MAG: beta-propeller fold lactonase family protein [Verrucomicrobiota bacterium]
MKPNRLPQILSLVLLSISAVELQAEEDPFTILAPSRDSKSLILVSATPGEAGLDLKLERKIDLGYTATTIVAHPEKPFFYITSNQVSEGQTAASFVDFGSSPEKVTPFEIANGYAYLSLDRANRFLLGANYRDGFVDVYEIDASGKPGARVSMLNEGRKNAHCVLTSPDNRFVYIPYVKDTNALFQYAFDGETGALSPLEKLDAGPPEGTGPRHLAYHPSLPVLYFSNEQHLGVSVYDQADDGQLTIKQVADLTGPAAPEEGVSSSDIAITPDGKFLFAGIRGHKHEFDFISRYRILENGKVEHLGLTPADKIPWGLTLSPASTYLLASGFGAGTLMAFQIGDDGELTRVGSLTWDPKISDLVSAPGF